MYDAWTQTVKATVMNVDKWRWNLDVVMLVADELMQFLFFGSSLWSVRTMLQLAACQQKTSYNV